MSTRWPPWLNWPLLNAISDSFLSRALLAWSISVFLLTSLPGPLVRYLGLDDPATTMFWGAVAFILGYLVKTASQPVEMSKVKDILTTVAHLKSFEYESLYTTRRNGLASLVQRCGCAPGISTDGPCLFAMDTLEKVEAAAREKPANPSAMTPPDKDRWKANSALVYHADLYLRQYDRRFFCWLSGVLLAIGIGLLVGPSIWRIPQVLFGGD